MDTRLDSLYTGCEDILPGSAAILKHITPPVFRISVYDAPEVQRYNYKAWRQLTARTLYTRECEYIQQLVDNNTLTHAAAMKHSLATTRVFVSIFQLEEFFFPEHEHKYTRKTNENRGPSYL